MDKKELVEILKNCYKKLKSNVYYSNNLIHIKFKVVNFEKSKEFDGTFVKLAQAILDKKESYFDELLKKISWIPQIKKIKTVEANNEIVSNFKNDDKIQVEKVNFFIDAPIELYILDTFWTILFGKSLIENEIENDYVRANVFSYGLYNKEILGLNGINFNNLNLYEPYFKNYKKWKGDAIQKVSFLYKIQKDSTIISLDLSGYFYNVDLDFEEIMKLCKIKDYDFSFESKLIIKMYTLYKSRLKKVRTKIDDKNIIPIGLISSGTLANYFLYDFDMKVKEKIQKKEISYYSRYVDDILFVLPKIDRNMTMKESLMLNFSDLFNFSDDYISIIMHPQCVIQNKKIKMIQNDKDCSRALIESMKEDIPNPSEANLMPNIEDSDLENFLSDVYNKKNESLKIRENDGIELNKYNLMRFMRSYVISKKNTLPDGDKKSKYSKLAQNISHQLELFFDSNNLFLLWDRWEKIFEFTYLNDANFTLTERLINKIEGCISSLDLIDADIISKNNNVLIKLRKFLLNNLIYSIAAVFSLKPFKNETTNILVKKAKSYLPKIRWANYMNHNLVGIPLANYLKKYSYSTSDLFNIQHSEIIQMGLTGDNFDLRKIEYTPRFIHFGEYMLCRNLMSFSNLNDVSLAKRILDDYNSLIHTHNEFYTIKNNEYEDKIYKSALVNMNYNYQDKELDNVYVALGNVNLSNIVPKGSKIILDGYKNVSSKMTLFKILNQCIWNYKIYHRPITIANTEISDGYNEKIQVHVDFLVFPELYLPSEWLDDIMAFSRKNGIGIITGVKYCYVKESNKLINSIATIIPFRDEKKYKYSAIFIREKNDYAPKELELLRFNKYENPTKDNSFNYIFKWNNISFSVFNCYELTDIRARALLKSKVDIIFAPQLNRDISYFSSIIESTSKDNGCFVVQVNSSHIGDTRIVGPYHSNYSNICSISGGIKDSLHIGRINIKEYKEYKEYIKSNEYIDDITELYKGCRKSKKKKNDFSKFKSPSARS